MQAGVSQAQPSSARAEGLQDALARAPSQACLEDACLGKGLPPEAERRLRLAGLCYHRDEEALAHIEAALRAAPEHPAVHIASYRFYFYKNRLPEALGVALTCLEHAARAIGIARDWRKVRRNDADFARIDAVLPRFFLFALKAYAYLQLRLGYIEEGRAAAEKLLELDPGDKPGARVLLDVLERRAHGDED